MTDLFPNLFQMAMQAEEPSRMFYGRLELCTWPCVLVGGKGKQPFNPKQHKREEMRPAVTIRIEPLPEQNISFDLEREVLITDAEWYKVTLPSLRTLGVRDESDLEGRWCKAKLTKSGGQFKSKASGKMKDKDCFEILALYVDEAECRAAFRRENPWASSQSDEEGFGEDDEGVSEIPMWSTPTFDSAPIQQQPTPLSPKKQQAINYIGIIAKRCRYSVSKTREECRMIPGIKGIIDVDSPEFERIVEQATSAQ
jgi:hypothetical protein